MAESMAEKMRLPGHLRFPCARAYGILVKEMYR